MLGINIIVNLQSATEFNEKKCQITEFPATECCTTECRMNELRGTECRRTECRRTECRRKLNTVGLNAARD